MRILIVSTFFPPLNSIASLRPYSWAKYWTLAGHDVTVLTVEQTPQKTDLKLTNPGYRILPVKLPEFVNRLKKGYQSEGAPSVNPEKPSWKKRLFDWLRYKRGVFNACRMPDFTHLWIKPALAAIADLPPFDLVVSTAGPYPVHLVADAVKRRGQAVRWIADYRDTWSNNYIYDGLPPFSWIEKVWEKRLLKRADVVTTVSDPFAEQFRQSLGASSVYTIPNGFDPEDLSEVDSTSIFPEDGKVRIVHTGTLYLGKRNPRPLFEAIKRLSLHMDMDRLEVLFVGPRQADLQQMIADTGVQAWVKEVGFVPREDALKMQAEAHALLFLPWTDSSVDGVLTGKIFEYLFSKTSILAIGASSLDASQRLIQEAHAGTVCLSLQEVENALKQLLEKQTRTAAEPKIDVLNRYDRQKLAMILLQV